MIVPALNVTQPKNVQFVKKDLNLTTRIDFASLYVIMVIFLIKVFAIHVNHLVKLVKYMKIDAQVA